MFTGLAAQIFFFSPIPVIQKMVAEKNTGTLPLLPYSAMCTNGILWTTYVMRIPPVVSSLKQAQMMGCKCTRVTLVMVTGVMSHSDES